MQGDKDSVAQPVDHSRAIIESGVLITLARKQNAQALRFEGDASSSSKIQDYVALRDPVGPRAPKSAPPWAGSRHRLPPKLLQTQGEEPAETSFGDGRVFCRASSPDDDDGGAGEIALPGIPCVR